MKTYTVLFAEDVPCYGTAEIEAENDDAALEAAKAYDQGDVAKEPEWSYAGCLRIIHIEDPEGRLLYEDIHLDDWHFRHGGEKDRLLCDAAAEMLEALELCEDALSELARIDNGTPSVSALKAARAAIARARGDRA